MVKLAVIALHGIGNPDPHYYDTFERKLRQALSRINIDQTDYLFKGIRYSSVFEEEANKITDMTQHLNWKGLRRFITHSLGDALAYQAGVSTANRINFYQLVHQRIDEELEALVDTGRVHEDTAVLFIAHSLGAYIISNYIWDKQKQFPQATTFSELGTLCGLITIGCNIPILTLGFDYDKLYPITLPGFGLSDHKIIKWINIYDKNDPLSLPMEKFYSYQTEAQQHTIGKIRDVEMNVGNIIVRHTPYSHTKYWNHSTFVELIRDHMFDLLEIL